MGKDTTIPWADHSFNVVWGCSEVSPGCDNCYAREWARRFGTGWGRNAPRRVFPEKHWNEPLAWNRKAKKEGRRHRVFCSSMADVFEDNATVRRECDKLWPLIDKCDWLDWILVTKRIQNACRYAPLSWRSCWPANTWIVTTAENQKMANLRMPHLLSVPCQVRGVSVEPQLEHINLTTWMIPQSSCCGTTIDQDWCVTCDRPATAKPTFDWVICGGESEERMGQAREFRASWARSIKMQCDNYNIAFFMKQLGSNFSYDIAEDRARCDKCGTKINLNRVLPDRARMVVCPNALCGQRIPARWNVTHPKGEDFVEFPPSLQIREWPTGPLDNAAIAEPAAETTPPLFS